MATDLKVNAVAKSLGTILIKSGIGIIRSSADDFEPTNSGARIFNDALKKVGLSIPVSELDFSYYYTTWDNWQKIVEVLYNIVKDFRWEAQRFDCDNRSHLMTSLCSALFRLNTCATLYCEVEDDKNGTKYLHYANIIFTSNGEVYLFDVDNFGLTQKITSKNIVMGRRNYRPISIRIF